MESKNAHYGLAGMLIIAAFGVLMQIISTSRNVSMGVETPWGSGNIDADFD